MTFAYDFSLQHLLGIEGLNRLDIEYLLDRANEFVENRTPEQSLKGKTLINLFFENSTRTQSSFDISAKRLGADVVNMSVQSSSVKKGETLVDTAMTLNAMQPDLLVIRHGSSGAVRLLSRKVDCAVVNAGDGTHEHPTQALLDALTIRRRKGRIEGLKVAICGDILHSRVARSNAMLLHLMGAEVRLVAPPTLMPPGTETWGAHSTHTNMIEGISGCDVVMMLRLQLERMHGLYLPSKREFFHLYGLDKEKLSHAAPDALIMHPGPMNRGVEIDSAITESENSTITEQVSMGVFVRMAVLDALARNLDRARAEASA
ncbi:aspartate carbamoyltransferase catalytic subunit [Ponticaulis sp.]|uniref:aspartate carbamoyltransferase catalytic subunit n=1 Tax=Ponticaulis sp. TaxID=2020902 RepID=UPI000B723A0C|nr:aspartate carbamoyltransferase catalytic subunit [Ponticaulis sp.]MAJ09822.1 aspartate carbamoyltransferase catalytic subunit [Ponticaulis sp.]RPG17156.1 MAG: aspartate carbamoyltransferase catalytic subunit [Hyphomonadaceae bacterium TMED125]HBH90663.1 aspartate carbamoyltransferase catalytic subunit [Hyphomonadaceae bacterium]HBJ92994.1 aspartate carbamoyltransferase catalytic subunit [Hyphomonadaceae bacterium]|tara:strand:- start:8253 stop:9203 length:951 start_codon:yes stop_codon:yes gene_type:complete